MPQHHRVIIVGAGPAGLGAARELDDDAVILEAEAVPGGLMRSKTVNGYIFDWAGHIFFTKIQRVRELIEHLQGDDFHWQNRESWVFSKSIYTRYPFQGNTYGLPVPVIKECLLGLIETTYKDWPREPENFEEWIYQTYGSGIARHFMIPYNTKLWARDLGTMDHHWLAGRVPRPGLSDFIDGALGPGRKDMGPNARFGYPLTGGMQTVADRLAAPVRDRIRTSARIVSLHPEAHTVTLASGEVLSYDTLILTAPLPDIVDMTEAVPDSVRDAKNRLEYLSVLCVNVGIHRPNLTDKHWIYFPESEFLFHRIFVQGNAAPQVCPEGCFSYTAEITYNSRKRIDFDSAGRDTVDGLIRAGLMAPDDRVDAIDLIDIPVAYVVPTHNRRGTVNGIREWYQRHDIHLLGRFAEWEYYNMDHAVNAGWSLAEELKSC